VSFVSAAQSFNTTSSMGRLTLNVLPSFAQFERELIGERVRVRDKIAASERKGIWVGGPVPLGYRCTRRPRRCGRSSGAISNWALWEPALLPPTSPRFAGCWPLER
jgi:DNA invertase Pin-like site-specific DNA recombinase